MTDIDACWDYHGTDCPHRDREYCHCSQDKDHDDDHRCACGCTWEKVK